MDAMHSPDRSLGRLEGMVEILLKDGEKARSDRKLQYERLEVLERATERVEHKLDSQSKRITAVEQPIENFNKWKERFIGMTLVWTIISGAVGSVVTYYWQKIIAVFTG